MTLDNLTDALRELDRLRAARPESTTAWSVSKTLRHCAQSIDYSLDGYPAMKPAFIRKTVGRIVLGRFMKKGAMSHDKEAPVPGGASVDDGGSLDDALATLKSSIDAFVTHDGLFEPHFIFDAMSKEDYERLHAMHLADHLSAIRY